MEMVLTGWQPCTTVTLSTTYFRTGAEMEMALNRLAALYNCNFTNQTAYLRHEEEFA